MRSRTRIRLPLLTASALLLASVAARSQLRETTFAGPEMTGQPMAVAVDDAGRVFVSSTSRAFGRGVISLGDSAARRAADSQVFSCEGRRRLLQQWARENAFAPELDRLASFYGAPGDGGANFLTKFSERVLCLTDADGNGMAERSVVVADGFHDVIDGPAGGVLVQPGGRVWFGCTPSLWRTEDDSGDLRADRQLPVFTGFGVRCGNGFHGLRALAEGPDGMIYFTAGDRGSMVESQEGLRLTAEATGAVFRCRADSSDLELLAQGLRDPAGLAIDDSGRVFVADAGPEPGRSRILFVIPGADFGWDANSETMPADRPPAAGDNGPGARDDPGPAWILPPCGWIDGAASGLLLASASAHRSQMEVGGVALLMADRRSGGEGGILRVRLQPDGAGFSANSERALWTGGAACGLAAGPEGSLYWADWGTAMKATSVCRICRLRGPEATAAEWRHGAGQVLSGLRRKDAGELEELLESPHPLVRRRARDALVARGFHVALTPLVRTARREGPPGVRLNAMWGIGSLARENSALLNELTMFLGNSAPEMRAAALRILGDHRFDGPPQTIINLLRDLTPAVRMEAAGAIGRIHPPGAAAALEGAIIEGGDPWLRHSLARALGELFPPAVLARQFLSHEAKSMRMAAVLALRMADSPEVALFLDDADPDVAIEAARAIHDKLLSPAMPVLARALRRAAEAPAFFSPAFVRRALAAALWTGSPESAETVATFLAHPVVMEKLPEDLQIAALETLAAWDTPPESEPVSGRVDTPLPRPHGIARPHLQRLLPELAKSARGALTARVKPLAAQYAAPVSPNHWLGIIGDRTHPEAARIDALQQLAVKAPVRAIESCRALLAAADTTGLCAEARTLIMKLEPGASYTQITEALLVGAPQEKQAVLRAAARFDSREAERTWLDLGRRLTAGLIDPVARVEVLESLEYRNLETRDKWRRLLELYAASLDEASDPLASWRICQEGGDAGKGRIVFTTHPEARCTECHSLRGRGGATGPALDGIGSRTDRGALLAALLQPSARVEPRYHHVTVTLNDERRFSGLLRDRNESSLLLLSTHGPMKIPAGAVQQVSAPVSPMPPVNGLLTHRELRDLIAFLASLKDPG